MAFYCESCKCIYSKKYANCPKCGDQIKTDSLTDDDLLVNGYSLFGVKKNASPSDTTPVSSYRNPKSESDPTSDDNVLNEIRAMFESGNTTDAVNNIPANNNTDTTTISPAKPESPQNNTSDNINSSASGNEGGFFDNLDAPEFRIDPVDVPKIVRTPFEPTRPAHTQEPIQQPKPVQTPSTPTALTNNENPFSDTAKNQPRRNTGHNRVSRFYNFLARNPIHIPWHLIRRLLPFILIICAAIAIYVSRELILNTIMEFVIGIIPIALVVGAIIYIIRRFFRS